MFCEKCSKPIGADSLFCPYCGAPRPAEKEAPKPAPPVTAPETPPASTAGQGVSTASFVLGLLGIISLGFATGIPAIIMGNRALKRGYAGRAMARTGVILGWITIAIWILVGGIFLLAGGIFLLAARDGTTGALTVDDTPRYTRLMEDRIAKLEDEAEEMGDVQEPETRAVIEQIDMHIGSARDWLQRMQGEFDETELTAKRDSVQVHYMDAKRLLRDID